MSLYAVSSNGTVTSKINCLCHFVIIDTIINKLYINIIIALIKILQELMGDLLWGEFCWPNRGPSHAK